MDFDKPTFKNYLPLPVPSLSQWPTTFCEIQRDLKIICTYTYVRTRKDEACIRRDASSSSSRLLQTAQLSCYIPQIALPFTYVTLIIGNNYLQGSEI